MNNRLNPYITAILVSLPFVYYGAAIILPTFDDWTTLCSPNYDKYFAKYLLPYGTTWRPFDALMGYVNSIDHRMYPYLNHILVVTAHAASTLLIFALTRKFGLRRQACNMATAFFYISPCICGTIFSCDALNQSYSQLWGLASVYAYTATSGGRRVALWALFVFLSALAKDNGVTWALIPPMVAFAFGKTDYRALKKHLFIGAAIAGAYFTIRFLLPHTVVHNGSHIEQMMSLGSKIKGLVTWIGYNWFAIDYISIVHAPSRNLLTALITLLLSAPLIAYCLLGRKQLYTERGFYALAAATVVTASPNLLISMSVMNAYCTIGITALIIGYTIDRIKDRDHRLTILFLMYTAAALFTDVHHWYKSWQTARPVNEITETIIRKTGSPADSVYCILVRDDNPKFSSFCVPLDETIGWGISVIHHTGYRWPKHIKDTTIERSSTYMTEARRLAEKATSSGFDCAWIVDKKRVEVIKRNNKR